MDPCSENVHSANLAITHHLYGAGREESTYHVEEITTDFEIVV